MKSHQVTHSTLYEFSKPVTLEAHTIRLWPRQARGQKLLSFSSTISPEPMTQYVNTDLYGNLAQFCTFRNECSRLQIDTTFEMEHDPNDNPFGFVICPFECASLPLQYPANMGAELDGYIKSNLVSPLVDEFAKQLALASDMKTIVFLGMLARCLYDTIKYTDREEGAPMHPEQTLTEQSGSCRDSAVLYMESCRCLGIAARFVSGYILQEQVETSHQLHAWVEAFVPGAGWMGFDPTLGLACTTDHVAVAVARNPANAAPVSGSFRGDNASGKISYTVAIRESQSA